MTLSGYLKEGWIESFEAEFVEHGGVMPKQRDFGKHLNRDLQSFITLHNKKLLEMVVAELKVMEGNLDNAQISYNKDIDITELPDGLIAEMTGLNKGWKAGLSEAQQLITNLIKHD